MSVTCSNSPERVYRVVRFWRTVSARLSAFGRDDRGTVAMVFGLMATTMVMLMGGAVDVGRWLHVHSQTKAAVDSAVLAGARMLHVTGGDGEAAIGTARKFYAANVQARPRVIGDTIDFKLNEAGTSVQATGTAYIATPFLAVANIKRLAVLKVGEADASEAATEIAGGNSGGLEISLMLDTTGSMQGQKLTDLKAAANDLVNIVLGSGNGGNVRVALAPFAETVRPSSAHLQQVRGTRAATITVRERSGKNATYKLTNCVSERTGAAAYSDSAPYAGSYVGAVYTKSGNCTPGAAVVPLTSDQAVLTATIDSLAASGATAGQIGSAWAWYLLSPNWSSVWGSGAAPASYDDTHVKKIAILMTDGVYNTQYDANGVMTSTNGTASVNGSSTTQARTMCESMKAQGITVYTVGFALNSDTAIETMEQCATSPDTAYIAQNGSQLRQAFRDIAVRLSPLHLTN